MVVFGCCGGVALVFFVVEIFLETLCRDLAKRPHIQTCTEILRTDRLQSACTETLYRDLAKSPS